MKATDEMIVRAADALARECGDEGSTDTIVQLGYVESARKALEAALDGDDVTRHLSVVDVASLGDVVIVLTKSGQAGAAWIRGRQAPYEVTISYGGRKDDPPLSIRQTTVKVGWTAKAWRDADQETRELVGRGEPWWHDRYSEQQGDTAHNPADSAPISRTERRP